MLPGLRDDALAVLRRNSAPDVERCQQDPDGAHAAQEQAAQRGHGGILVAVAVVLLAIVTL